MIFMLSYNIDYGQSQYEMNRDAYAEYQKADSELNAVYNRILQDYADDTAFIKNVKTAQRIWIQFRDAEMKMKFPEREPGWYGSIHPVCVAYYKKRLTEERTKTLQEWLTGFIDRDACNGSIKRRN